VATATCKIKMKTERTRIYRWVRVRVVIARFNDKLTASVNTGIASCPGSSSERQPTDSSRWAAINERTRAARLHADPQRESPHWSCQIFSRAMSSHRQTNNSPPIVEWRQRVLTRRV